MDSMLCFSVRKECTYKARIRLFQFKEDRTYGPSVEAAITPLEFPAPLHNNREIRLCTCYGTYNVNRFTERFFPAIGFDVSDDAIYEAFVNNALKDLVVLVTHQIPKRDGLIVSTHVTFGVAE